MILQRPAYGLNFIIPRILCVVAMAIVTRFFKQFLKIICASKVLVKSVSKISLPWLRVVGIN
jgi:uncharacterized membrane protein